MIDFISIRDEQPDENKPVLFQEMFNGLYHVGYWNEEENGMMEYPTGDGWKWTVKKWSYIDE